MLDDLLESPSFRSFRRLQLVIALTIYGYAYLAPDPFASRVALVRDAESHAIGTALLFLSLYVATSLPLSLWAMVALACVLSFGFEYAQSFSAIRVFDWADLRMNALGVAMGVAIIGAFYGLGWLKRA